MTVAPGAWRPKPLLPVLQARGNFTPLHTCNQEPLSHPCYATIYRNILSVQIVDLGVCLMKVKERE